jgi:hypothetical protein
MRGITFNNLPPIRPVEPGRMDVVCFIGFAPLARTPLFSDTLKRWLTDRGWEPDRIDQLSDNPAAIRNTPVPLESWDAFCAVFDDRRLDRMGSLRGRTLGDPVTIDEKDRVLHVIVDRRHVPVTLTPGAQNKLLLETLAGQINSGLDETGASASLDPTTGSNLIIRRDDVVTPGELTVYPNASLGFPRAVQADSYSLPHYSGAAVKAFFHQGGRKCYFISMGDPLPHQAGDAEKNRQLFTLVWGKAKADTYFKDRDSFARGDFLYIQFPAIPHGADPVSEWNGASHLAGLADVTYLCLPDLADVLGTPAAEKPAELTVRDREVFVACSETDQDPAWFFSESQHVPEYDSLAYAVWKRVTGHLLSYLSTHARTVQLVAALPMPTLEMRRGFSDFMFQELLSDTEDNGAVFKHLQLVFPWLKTNRSDALPDMLEPPEGAFLGILATQSRRIGAFRSIAGSMAENAYDLSPLDIDAYNICGETGLSFSDRVSWFDFVPDGIRLQSDVTAALYGNNRYGAVRRIMILIQKAAQRIGLDTVFEPGSERIWRTVKDSLTDLLHHIYLKNGLRGKSSKEAYTVACGRSTMTRNDIDSGRLIANVTLQPAVPVEQIAVDVLVERDGAVLFGSDAT